MSPGVDRGSVRNPPAAVVSAWNTIAECDSQIAEGRSFLVLVLSNRRPPTGEKARLTRNAGPLGEILCYHPDRSELVARFDPVAVRRFLQGKLREAGWEA